MKAGLQQGCEIGRPSCLHIGVEAADGGGAVDVVGKGKLVARGAFLLGVTRPLESSHPLGLSAAVPVCGVTLFGILNVTTDSYSDGGRYLEPEAAIAHALEMVDAGADVIDVGAASSHPEAESVSADEEIRRLRPVLAELGRRGIPVSVDTWQPDVQRFALEQGAAWINDIRGFADPSMHGDLAASQAGLVVMHSVGGGTRATRESTEASDVWRWLLAFFDERVAQLEAAGVARQRLVLDPGMGLFLGSGPEPSVLVLRRLGEIRQRYGLPLLVSISRKSFLGKLTGHPVDKRGAASVAAELFAVERGATFLRTHDPRPIRDALAVSEGLRGIPARI